MIYADNAATTRMSRAAIDAMVTCMNENYGNPSSLYEYGQKAKELLEDARARVAACLGCQPAEVTFTSGGSEADNQAIITAAHLGARKGKKHIISTAFEHHAVLHEISLGSLRPGHGHEGDQVVEAVEIAGEGDVKSAVGVFAAQRPEIGCLGVEVPVSEIHDDGVHLTDIAVVHLFERGGLESLAP